MYQPSLSPFEPFQRSVSTFLEAAPDLYPPQAFDVPASSVPAPPPRADWRSYDGPYQVLSPEYQDFRESPAFLQVHRQILDRIQDIETFARRHSPPAEFVQCADGLNTFRLRLIDHGESFAGDRMPLLYGPGKRALDQVCQRLLQDELPLDFRRKHLREMCHQLQLCMATGPAFLQTAQALSVNPHGLRSAFLEVVQAHADEVLQRAYRKEHKFEAPDIRDSREVHGVNRMRLEYGLPGGNSWDGHSFATSLFEPHRQRSHIMTLRQALNPCKVAERLADRYLAELSNRLPTRVPERSSRQDLNPFFTDISEAVAATNEVLTPVPMLSLMEEDEATGACYWRRDPSLLQREVLLNLEKEGLVMPRPRVELSDHREGHSGWTLEAVDGYLYYVLMFSKLQPEPQALPVGINHLLALEREQRARASPQSAATSVGAGSNAGASAPTPLLPYRLLNNVLENASPEDLARIPARWLTDGTHLEVWLRRISRPAFELWLKAHPPARLPAPVTLPSLACSLTEAKRADLIKALLNSLPNALHDTRLVGPAAEAMAWPSLTSSDVLDVWHQHLCNAFPTLPADAVVSVFCSKERPRPLSMAICVNEGVHLRRMLELLSLAQSRQLIPPQTLEHALFDGIQDAMEHGKLDSLTVVAEFLLKATAQGLIGPTEVEVFLRGEHPGQGCLEALMSGQSDCVHWYFDLIQQLHANGALSSERLAALVAEPSTQNAVASYRAIANGQSEALRAFLNRLTETTAQGRLDPALLKRQLTCDGPSESGLHVLVRREYPASLEVWREAVRDAQRAGVISPSDVRDLISGHLFSGVPLMQNLLRRPDGHDSLNAWTDTVGWLLKEGALTASDIVALLRSDDGDGGAGEPPQMNDLMRAYRDPAMVTRYLDLVGSMIFKSLLPADEAEALLSGPDRTSRTPALIDAVQQQSLPVIDAYLKGLEQRGWSRTLSADALTRLMDGRSLLGRSALTTAVRNNDAQTLQLLLKSAFNFLRQGLIGKAQWLSLFEPGPATPPHLPVEGVLDAVDRLNPGAIIPDLIKAVGQVWASHLIEEQDAHHLLHRLTVGVSEAAARRAAAGPAKSLTP